MKTDLLSVVSLLGLALVMAGLAACENGDAGVSAPTQPVSGDTLDAAPSAATGFFDTGLPIDTPPAEVGELLSSPPSSEEAQWEAVSARARNACGFDNGQPDAQPAAIFKTTAGELRRRVVEVAPDVGNLLGSNWKNGDTIFIVSFRGMYRARPAPPGEDETPDPEQTPFLFNTCVYMGNGRTDENDNMRVGAANIKDPTTFEGLWAGP